MKIAIDPNLQSAYDEQYTDDLRVWRELGGRYKAQNILDVCRDVKVRSVLEVGAGDGAILMYLDQWGIGGDLHALEISSSGLDYIQRRNLKSLKSAQLFDGYTIPFPDDAVDLVILSHVLEHVEFPRLLLRELRRVARYQVIEVPCDFSFKVDQQVEFFLAFGHINIYTPALVRFLLKAEGFAILSDKLSYTAKEVTQHSWYKNRGRRRTWKSELRLNLQLLKRWLQLQVANQTRRELLADAYTLLCTKAARAPKVMT